MVSYNLTVPACVSSLPALMIFIAGSCDTALDITSVGWMLAFLTIWCFPYDLMLTFSFSVCLSPSCHLLIACHIVIPVAGFACCVCLCWNASCYLSLTASLRYDLDTQHAFIGDYSGQITLLKLEQNSCSVITTLKGHEGRRRSRVLHLVQASKFSPQLHGLGEWSIPCELPYFSLSSVCWDWKVNWGSGVRFVLYIRNPL